MRIINIELKNWGPHKHLNLDLNAPVVGIVGANGKGKSNLLQAIDYAFTANLNKQKAEKYIRNFGQPDGAAQASVTLVFEKGGKQGTISRTITSTTSKRRLDWDGESWTRAAEVEKKLEEILNTDKASLANAVFIKQGELANLVKGTPSERHTIFQKLMNLQFLEPRAEDVQSKLSAIRGTLQDFRPLLEDIRKEIKDLESKIEDYGGPLEELRQQGEKYANIIRGLNNVILLKSSLEDSHSRITRLSSSRESLSTSMISIPAGLGYQSAKEIAIAQRDTQEALTAIETDIKHLQDKMQQWNTKTMAMEALKTTDSQLAAAKASVIEDPKELQQLETVIALYEYAITYHTEFTRLSEVLENKLKALKECPTSARKECKEKLDGHEQEIRNLQDQLSKLAIDDHAWTIKLLALKTDTECPVCGSEISAKSLAREGETPEKLKARLQNELQAIRYNARSLGEKINFHEMEKTLLTRAADRERQQEELCQSMAKEAQTALDTFRTANNAPGCAKAIAELMLPDTKAKLEKHKQASIIVNQINSYRKTQQSIVDSLADVTEPDTSTEYGLQDRQNELSHRNKELLAALENLNSINARYTELSNQLEAEFRKAEDIEGKLMTAWDAEESLLATFWLNMDKDEQMDRNSIISCREMLKKAQELKSWWDGVISSCENDHKRLDQLRHKENNTLELILKNEDKQQLIDDLAIVKSLLMRNGVPLAFMNDVFTKITGMVQEMLNRMGANFNVLPDPDRPCSFIFTRTDNSSGFEMAQEQLSGGQAIRLALALLLSCQQVILPEVGLLVLDEPTSHIDAEGVENMRDLFLSMYSILNNSDMQLLMVDHNEKLTAAFDKTITL